MEDVITKLYGNMKLKDSFISDEIISLYPWHYQALLENIADILKESSFCWSVVDNGVVFHDITSYPADFKKLHHFRSFNLIDELEYVKNAWKDCLADAHSLIPAFRIKVEDAIMPLKTLHCKESNDNDDSITHNTDIEETQANNFNVAASGPFLEENVNNEIETITMEQDSVDNSFIPSGSHRASTPILEDVEGEQMDTIEESTINNITEDDSSPYDSDSESNGNDSDVSIDFVQERNIESLIDQTMAESTEKDVQYIPESINKTESTYDLLKIILNGHEIVDQFSEAERKHKKYPNEDMYEQQFETLKVKLKIQLIMEKSDLKSKINEICQRRFKKNRDIIPIKGKERCSYDSLTEKLRFLTMVKNYLKIN